MKKVISIILTVLLLASSSGLSYAQHFCGDYEMIAEITLGEKHLNCGMQMEVPGCNEENQDHDCCDNEYTQIVTDDNFSKAQFNIEINKSFASAFVKVFVLTQIGDHTSYQPFYADYNPPPLEQDFQVLYESFLI